MKISSSSSSILSLLLQAKGASGLEPEGPFHTPIPIDPSVSEYELKDLSPATNYIVIVKLFNEAGAAEQKLRITTLKEKSGKEIFFVHENLHHSLVLIIRRYLRINQCIDATPSKRSTE